MWIIRKFRYWQYNKQHQTSIRSLNASLKASYARNVTIDKTVFVSPDVTIGKYTYVNDDSILENCHIGNYCSISSRVSICPAEHDLYSISTYPLFRREQVPKRPQVFIGNDVLISTNVTVLKGVHVGNGAVIGAGAVVTKNVEPYEIVGGVPARHISWRFDPGIIEKIEKTEWWLKEPEEIIEIQKTLFPNHDTIIERNDI